MYCEKLHVKFLRYISGVHKKACNQAVVGELGRFPMFVDIIKCNLKYLLRIEALPEHSLLKMQCMKTISYIRITKAAEVAVFILS